LAAPHGAFFWPAARSHAQKQFLAGYRYDPEAQFEAKQPLARHAGVWFQWGRATHAAREVQALKGPKRPGEVSRVVGKAGYFDLNSMQKALLGVFGLRAASIRGTVGVEWLLWRTICGLGTAKRKRWDNVSRAVLEATNRTRDPMTRLHLRDIHMEIQRILDVKPGTVIT
jgi:hypothetical protein